MARAAPLRVPSLAAIALLLGALALAAAPTAEAVRRLQGAEHLVPLLGAAASRGLLQAAPKAAPSPSPAPEPTPTGHAQWVTISNYGAFREFDEQPKLKDGEVKMDKPSVKEFVAAPARGRRL